MPEYTWLRKLRSPREAAKLVVVACRQLREARFDDAVDARQRLLGDDVGGVGQRLHDPVAGLDQLIAFRLPLLGDVRQDRLKTLRIRTSSVTVVLLDPVSVLTLDPFLESPKQTPRFFNELTTEQSKTN